MNKMEHIKTIFIMQIKYFFQNHGLKRNGNQNENYHGHVSHDLHFTTTKYVKSLTLKSISQ
jgi:hypothetical protein